MSTDLRETQAGTLVEKVRRGAVRDLVALVWALSDLIASDTDAGPTPVQRMADASWRTAPQWR